MLKKGFLDRERVITVGELGYNLINDLEEEVFVKQMNIAVQKDMLMTAHLPHNNKQEGMKRIEKILLNNYDQNKGGGKYMLLISDVIIIAEK